LVPTRDKSEYDRRTLYMIYKRNLRLPFVEVFDAPDTLLSCARRERRRTAGIGAVERPDLERACVRLRRPAAERARHARRQVVRGAWPPAARHHSGETPLIFSRLTG
jgi:hypothetical protein